jgi:hypothetical protein
VCIEKAVAKIEICTFTLAILPSIAADALSILTIYFFNLNILGKSLHTPLKLPTN